MTDGEVVDIDGKFKIKKGYGLWNATSNSYQLDEEGNLVYRKTARNFNPVAAMCGKVCIAEVEELVPVGSLDPDHIHTPGIFVNKILVGKHEKRIENMTVSK